MDEPKARICKGCWQQMRLPIPLAMPLALPLRLVGIRRSRMNPNLCTICEMMFEKVMKRRSVELETTVLFADLRGYTALSASLDSAAIGGLLTFFYDVCGEAIWRHDGILNKTIGDAVMAVFNFPIQDPTHPLRALKAAADILEHCSSAQCHERLEALGVDSAAVAVGIGIATGMTTFGEFGTTQADLTAVGNVVNLASRLQGAADRGEILVNETAHAKIGTAMPVRETRSLMLKGYQTPVSAFAY